jgi:hypothetical protein
VVPAYGARRRTGTRCGVRVRERPLLCMNPEVGSWWQALLVMAVAVDAVGGTVGAATESSRHWTGAQRLAGPLRTQGGWPFAALHVHPFVIAAATTTSWAWAAGWYVALMLGTATIQQAPQQLRIAAATSLVMFALVAATLLDAGPFSWLGPLLALKLLPLQCGVLRVPNQAG